MAKLEVSQPAIMSELKIKIVLTGRRQAAIRTWLGCRILKLGARVIGCDVEIADVR